MWFIIWFNRKGRKEGAECAKNTIQKPNVYLCGLKFHLTAKGAKKAQSAQKKNFKNLM